MYLADIKNLLNCRLINQTDGDIRDTGVQYAYASDLMSDVLVSACPGALLLTGLTNSQAVRTCKIAAGCAVIFVRGKTPPDDTVELAKKHNIPIMASELSLFEACGILFANGLKGIPIKNHR
ncbi:MAG: transcriptional regulator [bacterium]|nr:transcriptional regulator [bacterium]